MPIHMYINSPGGTALYTRVIFIEVYVGVLDQCSGCPLLLFAGEAKKRCANVQTFSGKALWYRY